MWNMAKRKNRRRGASAWRRSAWPRDSLHRLFSFMPAPGINDEFATMFLAIVDSTTVPERAGAATETEDTRPLRVDIDAALAALTESKLHNGYLIIALQWLALNRHRIERDRRG